MYDIAIPTAIMALVFLVLLYALFYIGTREPLRHITNADADANEKTSRSDIHTHAHEDARDNCTLDGRVFVMALAWNDTIQSPQKVDMDANVYYQLWYSNVLRRGLDKIYTCPALFAEMMKLSKDGNLTVPMLRGLMAPYYKQETAPPNKTMPLAPMCHNP